MRMPTLRPTILPGLIALIAMSAPALAAAQAAAPLTLEVAIQLAQRNHPAAVEAAARAEAVTEEVSEARASYVPRLDALWQLNRASRNNVFGLLLPQSIVPPISGPVLGTDTFESAWGSAAGLLFSVEVFDFGRRAAAVDAARARARASGATVEATKLGLGVAAADAYLAALGGEQAARAARASVERLGVFQRTIKAQVDAELKPGADLSRVDADLAAARNQLIAMEQQRELALLRLAAAIGQPEVRPVLDAGKILEQQPGPIAAVELTPPAVRAAEEDAKAAEANRQMAGQFYKPKIVFNAAVAGRASGANVDGSIDNGRGFWPDVPNWAAGITVTFPLLDLSADRARMRKEAAGVRRALARVEGDAQRARTDAGQARVLADAASRIAMNIPVQMAAARQAEIQARARYEAGLTGLTEVADAQRVLAQAETEEALSSLALWRARLAQAAAEGDLTRFLAEVLQPTGPRMKP